MAVLEEAMQPLLDLSYEILVEMVGEEPMVTTKTGPTGKSYQLEF